MGLRDDDRRKRQERREREDEADAAFEKKPVVQDQDIDRLTELIHSASVLVEQVHHLYHQYFAGVEKRPPIERRKQLEEYYNTLTQFPKSTPSARFKFNSFQAQYLTYCELWDKKLKEREATGRR